MKNIINRKYNTPYTTVVHAGPFVDRQLRIVPPKPDVGTLPPLNNLTIVEGNAIIDDAKMIGITPPAATFIGMLVLCPPYIFLPTTRFAYCTGILLSASVKNTTSAIAAIAIRSITAAITVPIALNEPPSITYVLTTELTAVGILDTIPAKIIIEIPLPKPFSVISSPSHTINAVPAVNVNTITKNDNTPGFDTGSMPDVTAIFLSVTYKPAPCINASAIPT